MANLLGDVWQAGEPRWAPALSDPRLRLQLYGKTDARPGRKMGHLTGLAASADQAAALVRHARQQLIARS
jgi:5-(carboxyamino)imidazole ribonucleotide synthase